MTFRYCLLLPLLVLLVVGCTPDERGTRLFEVTYPVMEFTLPAGQTSFRSAVSGGTLPTRFQEALTDNNVDPAEVDLVGGLRARVVSLTGDDFREIERIEVRACPVGSAGGCIDISTLLFSQADLFNRRQQTVDLSPSLVNHRELFLGNEAFRMELIFVAGNVTSRALEGRLEWSVMAVGDLD